MWTYTVSVRDCLDRCGGALGITIAIQEGLDYIRKLAEHEPGSEPGNKLGSQPARSVPLQILEFLFQFLP